jgi:hypothetical protein
MRDNVQVKNTFLGMKTAILRTHKRTESNSFSDADRGLICWSI